MQRRRETRVGRVEEKYVEMCSDGDVCLRHRKKYNLFSLLLLLLMLVLLGNSAHVETLFVPGRVRAHAHHVQITLFGDV